MQISIRIPSLPSWGKPLPGRFVRLLAVPVALGALAGLTVDRVAMGPAADTSASTAAQEAVMRPGQLFQDPPDANSAADPRLTIKLTAADARFNLSGREVWGQAYNGAYVAPTLHLVPGRTATIVLVNRLKVATNLHFHGLHVSPNDNSDDSFLCVAPGQTVTYRLSLPANHPLGTYWYHSHAMGTNCSASGGSGMAGMSGMASSSAMFVAGDVENQIFAGLSGAIVVGDDRTLLPAGLRNITAHTMVFKDVQVDSTGHIAQNTATTSIDSNNPTVRLVNGQLRPRLTMKPGQTQLWRLVNAGADIFYQLHLDGYRFTVIGEDGHPVAAVTHPDTLLLPPAKRFDVLVTAGPHDGETWLRTLAYSNGPQGDQYPTANLLKVDIDGRRTAPSPTVSGALPTAETNLANAKIAQHRTLTLSEDSTGTEFYINGAQFEMGVSAFATPAHLGTVEEWTIVNTTGEIHPFHLHTTGFQVISVNGVPKTFTGRQDIIPIPNEVNGVPGKVVLRIPFTDYAGQWMFHCHIAAHEDNGMMGYINVVA